MAIRRSILNAVFLDLTIQCRLPDFEEFGSQGTIVSAFGKRISDSDHFIGSQAAIWRTINGFPTVQDCGTNFWEDCAPGETWVC